MRVARVLSVALVVLAGRALADVPWTADEILALCDGTDDGLPCERDRDPREYLRCSDQRCQKRSTEFIAVKACGRKRPEVNELPAPEWTNEGLDRLRAGAGASEGKGGKRARAESAHEEW